MAHNPFNDLYVDSLDDVLRDARRSWEISAAICNRAVRQYTAKIEKTRGAKRSAARIESEPDSLPAQAADNMDD